MKPRAIWGVLLVGLSLGLLLIGNAVGLLPTGATQAATGDISTVAGDGTAAFGGDGGPATSAQLNKPRGVAVDSSGNLFIVDRVNNRIRKVDTSGNISTVAGTGTAGFEGDGSAATSARLSFPFGVTVDSSGNLFIADRDNHRIRKVDTSGNISTVAGSGSGFGFSGDGGPATSAKLSFPTGVAVDSSGNLFIADKDNERIRKVDTSGNISTVAGSGTAGFSGDGGPATSAKFLGLTDVAVDSSGNLFIADQQNHRIRKVDTSGNISTVAGSGNVGFGNGGFSGDGAPATSARLDAPGGVAVDSSGNIFIADTNNYRIRKVDTSGTISTVAGDGTAAFGGDGGAATGAQFNLPDRVAVDSSGNLFIADLNNHRIRKVETVAAAVAIPTPTPTATATPTPTPTPTATPTPPPTPVPVVKEAIVLVKDINPGGEQDGEDGPEGLINVAGTLFFTIDDGTNGIELWKSDGTAAGTVLVKDISSGANSGDPSSIINVAGTLYFQADDGTTGFELWKSDGTAAGTVLVKDINPGASGSSAGGIRNVAGTLLFLAHDGTTGFELWKSDGTAAGTVLVKDINPGAGSSFPTRRAVVGGSLYFQANDGTNGIELWKSDGTATGTVLVKDINPGSGSSSPRDLIDVSGTLFFSADDGTTGRELWRSDGTAAGTVLVKDINPGAGNSNTFLGLTNVAGTLFFAADDGTTGIELWKSNGTTTGTLLVKDIRSGAANSSPGSLTNLAGTLLFGANDGVTGSELWKSNGTTTGTVLLKDINPGAGNSSPGDMADQDIGGTLFFQAVDGTTGDELWKTDGTAAGTVLAKDIRPGASGSSPINLTVVAGTLFFNAHDGTTKLELWQVQPAADLAATKTDSPDPVTAATQLTYTITVTNNGPITSVNTLLRDTLMSGSVFVSATAGCAHASGIVTCNLGNLANGASKTITIVVTSNSSGTTAKVTSDTADSDATNNTVTASTAVQTPTPTPTPTPPDITTDAGDGTSGFSGDGGPATSASLNRPKGIAVDSSGNLFIADSGNERIRKVDTSGNISTVAWRWRERIRGRRGPCHQRPVGFPLWRGGGLLRQPLHR